MPRPDPARVDAATARLALADAHRDLAGSGYGQGAIIQRAWAYYCMRRIKAHAPIGCHMRDFAAWCQQEDTTP